MVAIHPPARHEAKTGRLVKWLAFALAIRWAYCLLLFATMGNAGITGVDSESYFGGAQSFLHAVTDGTLRGWQWVGNSPTIMPLTLWTMSINILVFGKWGILSYVMLQGIIDTATCYFVYRLAGIINPRIAIPAVIAATLNPTQIVLSGLYYTDTPFVFFVALFLLRSVQWLTLPNWRHAVLIGIGLGGALLFRPVIAPWVPAFIVFLLASSAFRKDLTVARFGQILTAFAIFLACATPTVLRNVEQYGAWSLTSQSGMHLSRWIAPLVREAKDGTSWKAGYAETERRTVERFGPSSKNPFVQSDRYRQIALEELRKLGTDAVIKAWAYGVAINIASPAIILSPPVSQLPRTGFYGTHGRSMLAKIGNFLFNSNNALYAWILLIGIGGVMALRLVQLVGVATLLRMGVNPWVLTLLAGWCLYILAANGPIASPKYRLPMEPVLVILTGAGVSTLLRWRRKSGAPDQS